MHAAFLSLNSWPKSEQRPRGAASQPVFRAQPRGVGHGRWWGGAWRLSPFCLCLVSVRFGRVSVLSLFFWWCLGVVLLLFCWFLVVFWGSFSEVLVTCWACFGEVSGMCGDGAVMFWWWVGDGLVLFFALVMAFWSECSCICSMFLSIWLRWQLQACAFVAHCDERLYAYDVYTCVGMCLLSCFCNAYFFLT